MEESVEESEIEDDIESLMGVDEWNEEEAAPEIE